MDTKEEPVAPIIQQIITAPEEQKPEKASAHAPVAALCYSPDGEFIIGVHGQQITLWNATTGKKMRTFLARTEFVSVAYNPIKNQIAVGDISGTISIYSEGGKWIRELPK